MVNVLAPFGLILYKLHMFLLPIVVCTGSSNGSFFEKDHIIYDACLSHCYIWIHSL